MKLLVTGAWNCTDEQLDSIVSIGHEVTFMQNEKDDCPVPYESIDGVICNGLFLHHPIEKFTSLKYVQLTSAGYDRVNMDYIESNNIEIHNARGVYSIPMAEYALWGALQFAKKGNAFTDNQKSHKWIKLRDTFEIYGKSVCIIGCGNVGTECAKRFGAMGCSVLGVDIASFESEYYSSIAPLSEIKCAVKDADFIVLTLPLTKESRYLINADILSAMKRDAVIINISRGAVVNTEHLINALSENAIGGAVLDVFEEEPLGEDSSLWDMENLIVTPHNSFVGDGNSERLYKVIMENLGK